MFFPREEVAYHNRICTKGEYATKVYIWTEACYETTRHNEKQIRFHVVIFMFF